MAQRMTETKKWLKGHFREMPPRIKLAWLYLIDSCDHAGIWEHDFGLLNFQIGYGSNDAITREEIERHLSDKLELIGTDKYFIPSFITFQYGKAGLKHANRVHASAIKRLTDLGIDVTPFLYKETEADKAHLSPLDGPSKGLDSPSDGSKDKDKEKDKENLEIGSVREREFKPETPPKPQPEKKPDPKPEPPLFADAYISNYVAQVPRKVQEGWLTLYPDKAWIERELKKAVVWMLGKPRNQKRDFAKFFSNWLSTGWDERPPDKAKPQNTTPPPASAALVDKDKVLRLLRSYGPHRLSEAMDQCTHHERDAIKNAGDWAYLCELGDGEILTRLERAMNSPSASRASPNKEHIRQAQALAAGLAGLKSIPEAKMG